MLFTRSDKANSAYRLDMIQVLRARDGDDCWFCGGELVFKVKAPQRRCTIEHLIPVAYGGPRWETWNLVLAHHRCNSLAADHPLHVKFAFRDRLRENGGYKATLEAGGGRRMLNLAGAEVVVLRRDRDKARRERRAEYRWRAHVPGHPGWALKRLGSLAEVARISFL